MKIKSISIGVLALALLLTPAYGQPPGGMMGAMNDPAQRQAFFLDMLSSQTGLDKGQRAKLKTILDESRAASKPLHDQLQKTRNEIRDAVKNGKTAEIEKLAKQIGALEEKSALAEAKTFSSAFQLLRPDQKGSADTLYNTLAAISSMEAAGGMMGMMGPPPGMMPPTGASK
jgi:hypothetical protein